MRSVLFTIIAALLPALAFAGTSEPPAINGSIAPVIAGPAVSSLQLKAAPGNLYGVYASCTATCWLMVFNSSTVPSNGSTTFGVASGNLQDCIPISSGGVGYINYSPGPAESFSNGIYAAISSTSCATLTLSAVGLIHGSVQ